MLFLDKCGHLLACLLDWNQEDPVSEKCWRTLFQIALNDVGFSGEANDFIAAGQAERCPTDLSMTFFGTISSILATVLSTMLEAS